MGRNYLMRINWSSVAKVARRSVKFLGWCFLAGFLSFSIGVGAVLLPPMVPVGIVVFVGLILLWVLPDLRFVPNRSLRLVFLCTVFVVYTVPVYYALQVPGLPWISVRRLFLFFTVALFLLAVSGSSETRRFLIERVRSIPVLIMCLIGFYLMMLLSIPTSASPPATIGIVIDGALSWYVPMMACVLLIKNQDDIHLVIRILICALLIDGIAGLVEFILQKPIYVTVIPRNMINSMIEANPTLAAVVNGIGMRRGMYRSISIYNTALAFGEFAAIMGPLCAYFIVDAQKRIDRFLGVAGLLMCIAVLVVTGARGAYLGFLTAMPMFLLAWAARQNIERPHSLVGPYAIVFVLIGFVFVVGLIFSWPRLHDMVLGGADTIGSDDARWIQWRMAVPRIYQNPITGHGVGVAARVVGYMPGGELPTLDSDIISLLVEVGIPGFALFVLILASAIWINISDLFSRSGTMMNLRIALASSLTAFAVYRIVLSQRENHTVVFLLIAITFTAAWLRLRDLGFEKAKSSDAIENAQVPSIPKQSAL